jgi:hypothetical protein
VGVANQSDLDGEGGGWPAGSGAAHYAGCGCIGNELPAKANGDQA